jgi:NAD(P)H-nitrite reductase large subunit
LVTKKLRVREIVIIKRGWYEKPVIKSIRGRTVSGIRRTNSEVEVRS